MQHPQGDRGRESRAPGLARTDPDAALLDRLAARDEAAFNELVGRYQGLMQRIAVRFVPTRAIAEEVVQDTWIAVLRGLPCFERRSSLRTWMLRILTNRARSRGQLEVRAGWIASLDAESDDEPAVDRQWFSDDAPGWIGHWRTHPRSWDGPVEQRLLSAERQAQLRRMLEHLPVAQRIVVMLRDVEGWPASDVCLALECGFDDWPWRDQDQPAPIQIGDKLFVAQLDDQELAVLERALDKVTIDCTFG